MIGMELEFVKNTKGKDQLIYRGFIYNKERELKDKTYWKCIEYYTTRCKGRVHTAMSQVVRDHTHFQHNHEVRGGQIGAARVMSKIREATIKSNDKPQQILAVASLGISESAQAALPSDRAIAKTTQRIRNTINKAPTTPSSLAELIIQQPYSETVNGEKFLQFDSGVDDANRFFIFSTARNLDTLAQSDHWFCDGTFKSTPPLFTQVLTIHSMQDGSVLPMVYVLVPNKQRSTYNRILTQLIDLKRELKPVSVMTDYETALYSAFQSAFPGVRIRGCFYHFGQCFWRRIQQEPDIQAKYRDDTDPDFQIHLKTLMSLAFVPVPDVIETFMELLETSFFKDNENLLSPLVNYFEDTWIGRPNRRGTGRSAPLFPLDMWNQYQGTLEKLPKTNNYIEGWHKKFSSLLDCHHPNIWKFLDKIKESQSLTEMTQTQLTAGRLPRIGQKTYRDTAERIIRIIDDYGNKPIWFYLKGLAFNFDVQKH